MRDFDLVIVGGGIAGASLGAALGGARRALIIEAEDHCAFHATGRSAAFWMASYGGEAVIALSRASHGDLASGWPANERSWLRTRGAVHVGASDTDWSRIEPAVREGDPDGRWVDRAELEQCVPGIRPRWSKALTEPSCADIDVAGLHQACLAAFKRNGGIVRTDTRLLGAKWSGGCWSVETSAGPITADLLVNAAGAWADGVARSAGVRPLGIAPKRRTMLQLRVGRSGLVDLPLISDASGTFYFKGEGDNRIWLSPHDEIDTDACDAAPEEMDVAIAVDRFEQVVDWPIEAIERRWAGLRSFAPDRAPVYGFDPATPGFFWCAGQGGFGIQTAPAAAKLCANLVLGKSEGGARYSPRRFR